MTSNVPNLPVCRLYLRKGNIPETYLFSSAAAAAPTISRPTSSSAEATWLSFCHKESLPLLSPAVSARPKFALGSSALLSPSLFYGRPEPDDGPRQRQPFSGSIAHDLSFIWGGNITAAPLATLRLAQLYPISSLLQRPPAPAP
ncbi:hypothetical protein DL770_007813 [Monosporascus sp. CRB-9-2]|nr:hypothetical protein DL770_007813 [Monosporascus sp. CRB-9-2]